LNPWARNSAIAASMIPSRMLCLGIPSANQYGQSS
jgi:hypothetical protein